MPERELQNERYRAGLCCDCGEVPYAPGRPRCDGCHGAHVVPFEPGLKRQKVTR